MNIEITRESSIKSIQEPFNNRYPFLKLEFFRERVLNQPYDNQRSCASSELLRHLFTRWQVTAVSIHPERSVAALEQDFVAFFGAYIQVFRKSGNVWIGTTLTSGWTLERQNLEGELISRHFEDLSKTGHT